MLSLRTAAARLGRAAPYRALSTMPELSTKPFIFPPTLETNQHGNNNAATPRSWRATWFAEEMEEELEKELRRAADRAQGELLTARSWRAEWFEKEMEEELEKKLRRAADRAQGELLTARDQIEALESQVAQLVAAQLRWQEAQAATEGHLKARERVIEYRRTALQAREKGLTAREAALSVKEGELARGARGVQEQLSSRRGEAMRQWARQATTLARRDEELGTPKLDSEPACGSEAVDGLRVSFSEVARTKTLLDDPEKDDHPVFLL